MKAGPQPPTGSNPSIGTTAERVSDKGPAAKPAGAAPVRLAENGLPAANQLPEDLIAQILGQEAALDEAAVQEALEDLPETDLPQGEIVLAQADIAPPSDGPGPQGGSGTGIPGVSEADLAQAQIRPWGSTLVMNLPDGRVLAVPGYFPGQNIGLPPDVAANGLQVQQVTMTQFESSIARLESAQAQQSQFQQQGGASNQQANNPGTSGANQPGNNNSGNQPGNNGGGNQGSGQNLDPAIANLIGEGTGVGPGPDVQLQELLQGDPELARLLQDIGVLNGTNLALLDEKTDGPVEPDIPVTTDLPRTVDDPKPPEPVGPLVGDPIPVPLPPPVDPINFVPPPLPPQPPPPVTPGNVGFLSGFGGGSLGTGSGPLAQSGSSGSTITRSAATGENGNAFSYGNLSGSVGSGFSASGPSGSLGGSYAVGGLSGGIGAYNASGPGGSVGSGYSAGGVGGSLGGSGSASGVSGNVGSGYSSSGVSGSTGSSYGTGAAAAGSVGNSGTSGPGGSAGSSVGSSGVNANVVTGSVTAAAPPPDAAAGAAGVAQPNWYTLAVRGTTDSILAYNSGTGAIYDTGTLLSYNNLMAWLQASPQNADGTYSAPYYIMFVGSTADDATYGVDSLVFSDSYNWYSSYSPSYSKTLSYGNTPIYLTFEVGDGALTKVDAATNMVGPVIWTSANQTSHISGYDAATFQPSHLHPEMQYIIYNTNIGRYKIWDYSGNAGNHHFALTGARDPNFVRLDAGEDDIDILSFYDPSNPNGGNGDYDFVTQYSMPNPNQTLNTPAASMMSGYQRITGIDVVEARGYGTNHVNLNTTAVNSITELLSSGKHVLNVAGGATSGADASDTVSVTDGSVWKYGGIVNNAAQDIVLPPPYDSMTINLASTLSRFGNVMYEFQNTNGSTFLNVSASFAEHPGWTWTDGGWGDDDVTDGNDFMEFPDTQFSAVNFGAGTDTLNMDGYSWNGSAYVYGKTFDFTTTYAQNNTGGSHLSNVEIISTIDDGLTGLLGYNQTTATAQQDTMVVDSAFVSSATDANKKLILIGDAADRVTENNFDTEWSWFASNVAGSGTGLTGKTFYQYYSYQYGAYLNVQTHMQTDLDINFNGWSGNDVFDKWSDLSFTRMHGGRDGNTTDTDTMKLSAAGNFDLTTAASKIWNMEIVDVAGNGLANTVSLNATTLSAITDIDHKLIILGDAASDGAQVLDTGWSYLGNVGWSTTNLLQYTKSGNTLYVESDLNIVPTKNFTGTSGSDTLLDYDGRYIGTFAFGAGTDTLGFATTGAYNLTTLSGTITGLDVVDAGSRSGADTVTVNKAFVAASTDSDKLSILGVAGVDGAAISDATNWMYVGTVTWNPGSGNRNFYQYKTNDGGLNTLSVQNDLAVTPGIFFYGAGLNDVFTAPSHSFTTMSGSTGTDTVIFSDGDYNMVGLQTKMSGMDVVDAASHAGADTVTVNKAFVAGAGENATINVLGTTGTDAFQFSDASSWSWVAELSGLGTTLYQYKATDGTATVNVQKNITNPGIIFYGTAGDNLFTAPASSYATLDGGAGTDTLRFSGTDFDLTGLGGTTDNLEAVDGTNSHADVITIDKAFVTGATDANATITVLGDAADSVTLNTKTDWSWVGEVSGFGTTLYQYKSLDGSATLNVQKSLAGTPGVFFNGTAGSDGFVAPDLTFVSLAAGAGTDWLGISGTDYDFTQAGVAARISNLEVIDASKNAGANTVVMNKTALATMTDSNHVLTVIGGSTDRLNLTDLATGWTYVGSGIAGTGGMAGKSFMQYLAVPEGYRINIQTELAASIGVYFNGYTGDEVFSYADLSFDGLHGGRDGNATDTDSLKLTGSGNFDLAGASAKIWNIEVVDLSGNSAANTVTIDAATLSAITDGDSDNDSTNGADGIHQLTILGDAASDGVAVSDAGWNFDGVSSGLGATLLQYSKGGNKLYVQADLATKPQQTYTGSAGNDTLRAYDGNFANLAFGAGTDTLQFATAGAYDLTSLTAANISGLEVVDASGRAGADTVTVNKAFVATAAGGTLTILGTAATDSAAIAAADVANWMYVGTASWNPGSGSLTFNQYKTNDGGLNTLNVQANLAGTPGVFFYGAGLDDVFTAPSHSFTTMSGGSGTDTVIFADGDYNMVGLQSKMSGMDVIDAASHAGADTVTVNKAFVVGAGENATINVLGTTGADSFQFADTTGWTWVGEVSGLGTTLYQYKATDGTATVNVQKNITNPGIIFYGTTGDNLFTAPDSSYATLDGGTGTDTLRFTGTDLDLTGLESKTANLEVVDGTNSHADVITVDKAFVAGASDANNVITILGDAADSVTLNGKTNWSWAGEVTGFGATLYQYKAIDNSATLNVQKNLAGTPGIFFYGDGLADKDDKFVAPDLTFDTLVGGTGTDWLGISGTDYDFTQAGIGAKISNLEVIDAGSNAGANTVTINKAFASAATDSNHILTVIGGNNDGVVISDLAANWSWLGTVSGSADFLGMTFQQYRALDNSVTVNVLDSLASLPSFRMIGDIGGASHDILDTTTLNFALLDGKLGTDFWKILIDGTHDVSTFGAKVDNIEVIDLGGIADGLKISAEFVRDATSANWLVVQGDAGDTLTFDSDADWSYAGYLDAAAPWPALHAFRGTADNGATVWAYADDDLGRPDIDAVGTSGNDLIRLSTKNFTNVNGGAGFDILKVAGGDIDLTSGKTVQGIDMIDAGNGGATTTVTVDAASVAASDDKTLYVFGDDNVDSVAATDNWTLAGMAHYNDGSNAYVYQSQSGADTVHLYAETTLTQSGINLNALSGTTAADTFCARNLNIGNVDGLSGLDRLQFLFGGNIDLTNLGVGNSIDNVEIIDTKNWSTNALVIDASFVHDQGNIAYLLGEAGDSFSFAGSETWTESGNYQISNELTLTKYSSTYNGAEVTVFADSNMTHT